MSLVVTAIFQFAYVVTCLPAAGAKARNGPKNALKAASRRKPGSSSKGAEGIVANLPVRTFTKAALLSLLLALVVGTPVLLIMMILFGAPLTTHLSHTTLTAAHLALLAVMPLAYVHGVDAQRWREIASAMMPQDEVYGATVGTLVGAWLGAVPIPLDWDREWQKWPVTIITGAYIGFATGKLLGEFVFRGRVIEFD
ncbi:MAG: Glycosylphosphatidylinositol (GPI) anchor assembly protein [Piccolia ochrophora]|nr:MAG: Glycosylphosphatidylinositol (GPI) anchor assembly protein [Piccolia ochrophora]